MQRCSLSIIEVVAVGRDHFVERNELDELPLRQIRRFVELDTTVLDTDFSADMR